MLWRVLPPGNTLKNQGTRHTDARKRAASMPIHCRNEVGVYEVSLSQTARMG